jgi:hypothetical protein
VWPSGIQKPSAPDRPGVAEDRITTLHFYYDLNQQKACQRAAAEKSGVSHIKDREALLFQIKPWAES